MLRTILICLTILVHVGCDRTPPEAMRLDPLEWAPQAVLADYVQERPGMIFRATLSPDNSELLFFEKVTPGEEDYRIMTSQKTDAGWTAPQILLIDGRQESDMYPILSADGNSLFFTSYRDVGFDPPNANLWITERTGEGWTPPEFLSNASTPENYESQPWLAPDGSLRFKSMTPDWRTTYRRKSVSGNNGFGSWTNDDLLAGIPTDTSATFIRHGVMNPQGDTVILEMADWTEEGRLGASDLWVSTLTENGWSMARRLPASINTDGVENFPIFSSDGSRLLFVRDFTELLMVPLTVEP